VKKLPAGTTVTVRGVDYTINLEDDPGDEGSKLDGFCDYTKCVIVIDSNIPLQRQWQTLWHELLHASLQRQDMNDDEGKIDYLAGDVFAIGRQLGLYGK
jgi:Zn-dependent peptidase ImmA (M78 family)